MEKKQSQEVYERYKDVFERTTGNDMSGNHKVRIKVGENEQSVIIKQ